MKNRVNKRTKRREGNKQKQTNPWAFQRVRWPGSIRTSAYTRALAPPTRSSCHSNVT